MHATARMQELDEEWRRRVLAYQQQIHAVAVKLLKAIFVGLGRDASTIDEAGHCPAAADVHVPLACKPVQPLPHAVKGQCKWETRPKMLTPLACRTGL